MSVRTTITIADWKQACGLAPDSWTHERTVDGILCTYWPDTVAESAGWWWCVADPVTREFLGGGFASGNVGERNRYMLAAAGRVKHSPRLVS